jgi:hypothetical protein
MFISIFHSSILANFFCQSPVEHDDLGVAGSARGAQAAFPERVLDAEAAEDVPALGGDHVFHLGPPGKEFTYMTLFF